MLLKGKVAVVYGAGSIGGAVAKGFGAEGARVFVGDRTGAKAEALAAEIGSAGGVARGLEVDALNEGSVGRFVETVVDEAGRLDVSFNLISVGDVQGTPLAEMEWGDFNAPIENAVRSNFLTVKAAVPQMARGGGGVVDMGGATGVCGGATGAGAAAGSSTVTPKSVAMPASPLAYPWPTARAFHWPFRR